MVSASFKANNEVFTIPIQWIPKTWHLENYLVIWSRIPLVTFLRIQLFKRCDHVDSVVYF